MVRLVIFDFDGTLGDTRQNIIITLQRTMRIMGLEVRDEATCAATIGLTLEDSFLKMYPDMSREDARKTVDVYRDIFYRSIEELQPELFPGVGDVVKELHSKGIILSVASSRTSPSLLLFLRNMGIADYFSLVLGADNVEHHKPHPEAVERTLRELGVDAKEAIVVGDMPLDVEMAHRAGVVAVGVSYGNASREELVESSADYVIDNILPLIDIVRSRM